MTKTSSYRPEIDGLRAIAILFVLAYHAFPVWWPGGFVGVDIFFVISGFLITRIIYAEMRAGNFSFMAFYARRFRRIVPALTLVLFAVLAFGYFALLSTEYLNLAKHVIAGATFTTNFRLLHEVGYFDTSAEAKPLMHLWSLGIEEQFYLLWPIAFAFLLKRTRVTGLWICILTLVSFAVNLWVLSVNASEAFYMIHSRFWELSLGCGLAYFETSVAVSKARRFANWFALAAFFLLIASGLMINKAQPFPGWRALPPTLAAIFLILAGSNAWLNRVVMSNALVVGIGLISYPLYLWHWSVLSFLRIIEPGDTSVGVRLAALALAFALSALTYMLLEKPIQKNLFSRLPELSRNRSLVATGFAALGVVTILGLFIRNSEGLPNRYPLLETPGEEIHYSDCGDPFNIQTCHQRGDAPQTVIVGDSRATNFAGGLALIHAPMIERSILLSEARCPYLSGVDVDLNLNGDVSHRTRCKEVTQRISEFVERTPSIQTIILVSRGSRYFSDNTAIDGGSEFDPTKGPWHLISTLEADQGLSESDLFGRGYSRSLSYLESLNKQIIFILEWPELGFDPNLCGDVRPLRLWSRKFRPSCTVSLSTVMQRQSEYRRVVDRLRADHPKVKFFDSLPVFCNEHDCSAMDGKILFGDPSSHLSTNGAMKLARSFSDWYAHIGGR